MATLLTTMTWRTRPGPGAGDMRATIEREADLLARFGVHSVILLPSACEADGAVQRAPAIVSRSGAPEDAMFCVARLLAGDAVSHIETMRVDDDRKSHARSPESRPARTNGRVRSIVA